MQGLVLASLLIIGAFASIGCRASEPNDARNTSALSAIGTMSAVLDAKLMTPEAEGTITDANRAFAVANYGRSEPPVLVGRVVEASETEIQIQTIFSLTHKSAAKWTFQIVPSTLVLRGEHRIPSVAIWRNELVVVDSSRQQGVADRIVALGTEFP